MPEALYRELIFFWYYFSILFSQIAVYWALGMFIGSLISVFGKEKLHSLFSAMRKKDLGILGIIPASLIGIASPLCMYGTIPISASFAENGMEEDWLAAFMMSSILLNPQILFYSAALGNAALIIRFVSCLLCGITAGLLVRVLYKDKKFFNFNSFITEQGAGNREQGTEIGEQGTGNREQGCCLSKTPVPSPRSLILSFFNSFWRNIKATGPALLIGITLSALFQLYVPPDLVAGFFGRHRGFGILMGASIGVPLYVCGGGTIPLLIAWMHHGMSLGSASAFMITGPAMKITNLGAVKVILRAKNFALYIAFAIVFALFVGFLVDFSIFPAP